MGAAGGVTCLCMLMLVHREAAGSRLAEYNRPPPSIDLPLTHKRLALSSETPHNPEQIHLALAGICSSMVFAYTTATSVLSLIASHCTQELELWQLPG